MIENPSDSQVSLLTRAFGLQDEQVFSGAGRGPTPEEAARVERREPVAASFADHYREMRWRGGQQRGEGRPGW